jgi:hypothetical protein
LKNPEKAFFLITRDWNARVILLQKAISAIGPKMELDLATRSKTLVTDLGKNLAELLAHYQAAYLQFVGNPCSNKVYDAYLKANNKIRRKETKLIEIEINTEKLVKLVQANQSKIAKENLNELELGLSPVSIVLNSIEKLVSQFSP